MNIFRVERSEQEAMEHLGTKPKFWFVREGDHLRNMSLDRIATCHLPIC
jgi:hypothetical protein